MAAASKDAIEERTRHWLEANYLSAIAAFRGAGTVYDADGQPRQLTRYYFQEALRKLRIFRWLDRFEFESFIDIGSGFDEYPNFVRERYGVSAYFSDFAHSMNLPYGGQEQGKLDHAVTLNIARLPFADDTFDVVLSSEVLEHLVRPVECIAELLRVSRRYLIMTSLEALSPSRWQRWLSHLRVDAGQPHVERNFFLLDELEAIFGRDWHHENLLYDGTLPASDFQPGPVQDAAYAAIGNVDTLVDALCRAASVTDHRQGAMGILIVKAHPGATVRPPGADDHELARWLIRRTASGHRVGAQLVEQIHNGTAPFAARERPLAPELLALLRCPDCRGPLRAVGAGAHCPACGTTFPGEFGVPILYPVRSATDARWLVDLSAGDPQRQRIIRRVVERLRRNENPSGPLRRLFTLVDRAVTQRQP